MLDNNQIALISDFATDDARTVFNDCDRPLSLSPANYQGDGEAFHFQWIDVFRHEISPDDREKSQDLYLEIFWKTVRKMQGNK